MGSIEENLNAILSNRYGEDVRTAIHDAIKQCYEDATEISYPEEVIEMLKSGHMEYRLETEPNIENFYIASNANSGNRAEGTKVTSNDYRGLFIKLYKGQTAVIKAYADSSANSVSKFTLDKTFSKSVNKGPCWDFVYEANEDMYLVVCCRKNYYDEGVVKVFNNNDYSLNVLKGTLGDFGWRNGFWTTSKDPIEFVDTAIYANSNPIFLKAYDSISAEVYASSSVYAIYAESLNGETLVALRGKSSSNKNKYEMTAPEDCYVYVANVANVETIKSTSIIIDRKTALVISNNFYEKSIDSIITPYFGDVHIKGLINNRLSVDEDATLIVIVGGHAKAQLVYLKEHDILLARSYNEESKVWSAIWTYLSKAGYKAPAANFQTIIGTFTSLNQFTFPYEGAVLNTTSGGSITDLPNNINGVLTVKPHNNQYSEQILYQYSIQRTLTRLIDVNGTPYNDWEEISHDVLYGKTVIGIGDSLMAGNQIGNAYTWLNLLKNAHGCIIHNYGKNGNPVAKANGENSSMVERIDDIYKEVPTADYIVVIGGANDKRLNVPIGEDLSEDISTFKGALNVLIDKIRRYYPKAHIVFMTNYDRYRTANTVGASDIDYVEAMLEICKAKHVFCYDNFHNSGVDFFDKNFVAWADEGIVDLSSSENHHFSKEAYKWLLPKYAALLAAN